MTRAALALALLLLGTADAAAAQRVRNTEYGLSVEVPAGLRACPVEPYEHPKGAMIPLSDAPDACHAPLGQPHISVLGEYNALFLPDLAELADTICGYHKGERKPPPDLSLPGVRSLVCRIDAPDRITILVLAQSRARTRAEPTGPLVPLIDYTITLRTQADRLDADLARLRALLPTVRFHQPR